MSEAIEDLREQYLDAVKLHLWYSDSPFSFFKGKANKQFAAQYKKEAQDLFEEIARRKQTGS